jgi:hypothetical protein
MGGVPVSEAWQTFTARVRVGDHREGDRGDEQAVFTAELRLEGRVDDCTSDGFTTALM